MKRNNYMKVKYNFKNKIIKYMKIYNNRYQSNNKQQKNKKIKKQNNKNLFKKKIKNLNKSL